MTFSQRSKYIAKLVKEEGKRKIADIGCDHGINSYLLLKDGSVDYIHITDISEKNLNKAKRILEKDFSKKIVSSVCDGLSDIQDGEVDLALISGMGGNEIISILTNKTLDIRYIFQPMKDVYKFRKYLNDHSFKIEKDFVKVLDNKIYSFLICDKGNEQLTKDELFFGKTNLKERSLDFIQYLKKSILKAEDILKGIDILDNRYKDILEYISKAKEIIDGKSY